MTIKELQEAKIKLDKELTESVRSIVDSFYKTNGIVPNNIITSIELTEVKVDYDTEPISSHISVSVKSNFKLA